MSVYFIKLRIEIVNMPKRIQPDESADNNRRPLMGLQCSEKIPYPEIGLSWPLNTDVYQFSEMVVILNSKTFK